MSKIKDRDIVKIKSREYNKVLKLKGKNNFYVFWKDHEVAGCYKVIGGNVFKGKRIKKEIR